MTKLLDRVPDNVRGWLASWQPWVALALAGAIFAITWLYFVNSRIVREEATRKATAAATAATRYGQCVSSIPALKKINTFLEGERDLVDVLVHNSLGLVQTTDASDPQYETRVSNLERLMSARAKIATVDVLPVPTPEECLLRRKA